MAPLPPTAPNLGSRQAGPDDPYPLVPQADPSPSPEAAFLYSAVLPGAGQFVLGQRRWLAYSIAEVLGWVVVLERRHQGGVVEDEYQELGWDVARQGVSEAPRLDGDFDYYETLSKWARSGSFDRVPSQAGIQPETDESTFNGSVWALAQDIFALSENAMPGDPAYERALDYYRTEAYGPAFLWDWSAAPDEQVRFGDLIRRSDDAFQQARVATGIVVANHLLSAVDGFVSARLRRAGLPVDTYSRVESPGAGGGSPRWTVQVRVAAPWAYR